MTRPHSDMHKRLHGLGVLLQNRQVRSHRICVMSTSKRITLTKAQMGSEFGTELIRHLQSISEDSRFSFDEIRALDATLARGPTEMPCVPFLRKLTRPAILDQQIDDYEAYELRLAVERVLPKALREKITIHLDGIRRPIEEVEEFEDEESATERQLDYIRILGGEPPADLGKWEASDLIDQLKQRAPPSNRQMMVLRFWNRLELAKSGRQSLSEWMDEFYAEDSKRVAAWELFKQETGDDGSQSNPSSVPLGAGYQYLQRVQLARPRTQSIVQYQTQEPTLSVDSDHRYSTERPSRSKAPAIAFLVIIIVFAFVAAVMMLTGKL